MWIEFKSSPLLLLCGLPLPPPKVPTFGYPYSAFPQSWQTTTQDLRNGLKLSYQWLMDPLMSLPFPSLPSTVCSQALSHLSHPYLPPMWVCNTSSFIDKNDPIASQTISPGSRRDGSRLTQCGLHGNKANWLIPRDWTSDTGSNERVSLRLSQPQHPLSPTPQAPPRSSTLGPTLPAVLWQRGWAGET